MPRRPTTPFRLARAAVAAYDLPEVELRPVRQLNNAVLEVVGPAARLALRIHRPGYRTVDEIRSELTFLEAAAEALRGSSVVVPRPIRTRAGDLSVTAAAGGTSCECSLLTWIDGRVLRHGSGLGPRASFLLGEGLGRLHRIAEAFVPPAGFALPTWDADTMFTEASPFRPGPMDEFLAPDALAVFEEVAEATRGVFAELDRSRAQRGILHNDYILGNCHFSREARGWRLGVLDFDDLGWGYFLYDLAPLLGNLFDYPGAYARLRAAFLGGYRSVRALPPALEEHLPVLMAARHAATLTWLAAKRRRGETDLPIERHAQIRVAEMVRCLALGAAA